MHRITSASLIAVLASGCVVGGRLAPAQLRARVNAGSAPPPPSPSAPAASSSSGAPVASLPDGCYEELGQDAPAERDRAMPIGPGTFDGCGAAGDNGDAFVIQAPASAPAVLYTIRFEAREDDYADIFIHDGDGVRLKNVYGQRPTHRAWGVAAGGTALFVSIFQYDGPYRMTISEQPLVDPDEPNDTREQATPLGLGEPHSALLASAGGDMDQSVDWYVLDIPRPGKLHVEVIDPGVDVEVEAILYNEDREEINDASAANKGANLRTDLRVPAAGRYYLSIQNDYGRPAPVANKGEPPLRLTQPYTITATLK